MIRSADLNDSGDIVRLLREGFPKNLFPYTIYSRKGYETYVSDLISLNKSMSHTRFCVCKQNGKVIGFTETRQFPNVLFLNNIYIDAHFRGKGLGTELLKKSIQMTRDNSQESICLDVFNDNKKVLDWYLSLGLKRKYEQLWMLHRIEADNFKDNRLSWWKLIKLSEANRLYDIYMFSEFIMETELKNYTIGKIGETLFKTTDISILNDISALEGLYYLDKNRILLIICEDNQTKNENTLIRGKIIAKSARLTGNIDQLLRRLAMKL